MSLAPKKILLIHMQTEADVVAIGVPALRYYKKRFADAEIKCLTFARGGEVIKCAEPDIELINLPAEQWPEHIIQAMESFIGLAEQIIGEAFDLIVNIDTWFMPNFLARFLKDAGENFEGNYLSTSIPDLIYQFQHQQLKPEYVNDASQYIDSTFSGMSRWHGRWWEASLIPSGGYPEFYLSTACGFNGIQVDSHIDVDETIKGDADISDKKVIALATAGNDNIEGYPFTKQLVWALEEAGYIVFNNFNNSLSIKDQLIHLKAADLCVTLPHTTYWLAKAVSCKTLALCGDIEPQIINSDYVIENAALDELDVDQLCDTINSIVAQSTVASL